MMSAFQSHRRVSSEMGPQDAQVVAAQPAYGAAHDLPIEVVALDVGLQGPRTGKGALAHRTGHLYTGGRHWNGLQHRPGGT